VAPGPRTITKHLAIVVGIVIFFPRATWPHAELLRSQPAAGSVIESAPREIHVWFSEPIEAASSTAVRVLDPEGVPVAADTTVAADDRTEMITRVTGQSAGTYTVHWRAISADGHPIDGTFVFSVGHVTAPATEADSGAPTRFVGFQAVGRWLHLLALSLVIGPAGLILLGVLPIELHKRLWTLSTVGALLLLPAAIVMLVAQSAAVAGTLREGLRFESLQYLLLTRWGVIWAIRTIVAIIMAVVLVRRHVPQVLWIRVVMALAAALIVTTSLNGHPGATPPVWLSLTVDWAHTAASAMWIGGLFALVTVTLPWASTLAPPLRKMKLAAIVPPFSMMALVCVQVLFVTGMYHTWAHVSGPAALTATPYGLTLLVKLGLVALTLAAGAVNLLIVNPRLTSQTTSGATSAIQLFGRVVSAEALLVVAILGSVGVLTSLSPASPATAITTAPAPIVPASAFEPEAPPALSLVGHAGSTIVSLSLASADVGSNRATIALKGVTTTGTTPVRLRIEPPDSSGLAASTVTPALSGTSYHASLALAPAGAWTISVIVTSLTQEDTATFHVTLPLSGARELLVLAEQRMNALRSVAEDVETFAEGKRSLQHYEYQAPDLKLHRAEMLEITSGDRLYMRHGTAWHAQTVDRFSWPSFQLAESARDVTVAGREVVDGSDCVILSFVNGPDNDRTNVWIASDTLRIVQQAEMTSEGLVTRRFTDFDKVAPIHPPEAEDSTTEP